MGSHCRPDQLDHPDDLNFPIEADKARLKGVDIENLIHIHTNTRPQSDQLNLCSIAVRASTDQNRLRLDISRVEVGMIRYRSDTDRVKIFNPIKLDRYTKASRSTLDQLNVLLDQ